MTDVISSYPPALPANAVLVHIGMHKTGTTAMQTVFGEAKEELRAHGVLCPGPRGDHHRVARALTQLPAGPGGADAPPAPEVWRELVAEVAEEPRRVVLSSEFFSGARDHRPARLVADLGPERVHVVVGLRNTVASAASAWQQTLKEGRVADIEQWAAHNLPRGDRPPLNPAFWDHWDLGELVRRWSSAAGPENVTVVVVDRRHRRRLPTVFERLLDLPAGFLADRPAPASNRGMTAREAELVRHLNRAVRAQLDWPQYRRFVRYGAIRGLIELSTPAGDEPRPALPAWAQDELRAAGRRAAERIAATGVRVVGDLADLYAEDERDVLPPAAVHEVPFEVAVSAVVGTIRAAVETDQRPLSAITAKELAGVLAQRAGQRVRRGLDRLRSRPGLATETEEQIAADAAAT